MADGKMSAADSNTSLPEIKSGYTFGHNKTLLLISLYQKYEVFFSDVSYKKTAIWQMIADDMKKNGYSSSSLFTREIAVITRLQWQPLPRPPYLLRNVYSCQDRASRRTFFYADNPNYS